MVLLVNDQSIHEQFHNIVSFRNALSRLMAMRSVARRNGLDLYCHRFFLLSKPIPGMPMQQAVGNLNSESERRSVMRWLTTVGPFWDDLRQHGRDDYFACGEDIVTDTAIGEAAFRVFNGNSCGLVSVCPSNWEFSPVEVVWHREAEMVDEQTAEIENWWDVAIFEEAAREFEIPVRSWDDLRDFSIARYENLVFTDECFVPLRGTPFSFSAANRFFVLLSILNELAESFDGSGKRTRRGQEIYEDYFTGDRAIFSDSSEREKSKFHEELTFSHPYDGDGSLFCTWHGKISHMTLRLHFSWPIEAGNPVFIVYAGPKITKR